ncbi:hypothetical protein F4801DRAFT_442063 [Xylaria longipes]|nr:hypothetical protein F4801DRAFT_442063 [Xylaria longipes]RYC65561.1 hypothetical protein CHU98_g666 [Xylaria longipes]
MKFTIVFAAFVATASAYRCKFDRYSTGASNLLCTTFNEDLKKGDQTEKDSCSNEHTYSCYSQHHGTDGDANCRLVIYDGAGCNAESNKLIVPCTGGLRAAKAEPHSYRVECD